VPPALVAPLDPAPDPPFAIELPAEPATDAAPAPPLEEPHAAVNANKE